MIAEYETAGPKIRDRNLTANFVTGVSKGIATAGAALSSRMGETANASNSAPLKLCHVGNKLEGFPLH
jgi:hypothetical protein